MKKLTQPIRINAAEVTLKFAKDVASGAIVAGKLQKLAAFRFLEEYEEFQLHGHVRGFRFSARAAQKVVNFFCQLQNSQGVDGYINPAPWQVFVISNIFGWVNAEGLRRFSEVYIEVARKNGKSTLMAAIALYLFACDDEVGPRVFAAAAKRDQADEVFLVAAEMVKSHPMLSGLVTISGKQKATCLSILSKNARFKPLAYEGSGKGSGDGKNVSAAILDELHQHPDGGQLAQLKQATLARKQALIIAITTAGYDREGICYHTRERMEKILAKLIPAGECDNVFTFIACADTEDDEKWMEEDVWRKANPSLGWALDIEKIRAECNAAKHQPSEINEFKRKHLCIWTTANTRAIDPLEWGKCARDTKTSPVDLRVKMEAALAGKPCYLGIDLAQKIDLNCVLALFPPFAGDGLWKLLPYFWMPKGVVQKMEMKDGVKYSQWVREKWIETTDLEMVDQEFIAARIKALKAKYNVLDIGYDPAQAGWLESWFTTNAITANVVKQTPVEMHDPFSTVLGEIVAHKVEHYRNPILTWMSGNVEARHTAMGLTQPVKPTATARIDGIVAWIIARQRAIKTPPPSDNPYARRGIVMLD